MTFEQRMKSVVWTETEVAVALVGAVVSNQLLADEKLFKNDFEKHPDWFQGNRQNAKFYIKFSGAIKAGAAIYASTYVTNPWAKLLLFGIAFQGTIQQARVLTYKDGKDKIKSIGDNESLDAQLKAAAEQYRTRGPEYLDGPDDNMNGPEYVGVGEDPLSNRYRSSVAARGNLGDRYESSVAAAYDEMNGSEDMGFNFRSSDTVEAY